MCINDLDIKYNINKNDEECLITTRKIVEKSFEHIVDKQGDPYIYHLIRVSERVNGSKEKIVALLHDIIEDTNTTKEGLVKIGYEDNIIEAVDLLSQKENQEYNEYIDKLILSKNKLALAVKKADLEDNMTRSKNGLDEFTKNRLNEKYKNTYKRICECVEKGE